MRKLKRLFTAAAAAGALALFAGATAANAATITVSSTVDQSGFFGNQSGGSYPLTGTPYDFTGQIVNFTATSLDSLTVTVTSVLDGDSGPGEFDENNLHLALDGIDTGLVLNGLGNNQIATVTLSQLNPLLQAQLLAALADNKLVGTILDTDADGPAGDQIGISGLVTTSLELTLSGNATTGNGGGGNAVPLPAAALIAPLGASAAAAFARRFRKSAR
jgi:hypothetical protein